MAIFNSYVKLPEGNLWKSSGYSVFSVDGFCCHNPIKNERWNVDPATSPHGILHFCQGEQRTPCQRAEA